METAKFAMTSTDVYFGTSMSRMPSEILLMIVECCVAEQEAYARYVTENLPHHPWNQALHSLYGTCKWLKLFVGPFLYRTITVSGPRQLQSLHWTLMRNPDLPDRVQNVILIEPDNWVHPSFSTNKRKQRGSSPTASSIFSWNADSSPENPITHDMGDWSAYAPGYTQPELPWQLARAWKTAGLRQPWLKKPGCTRSRASIFAALDFFRLLLKLPNLAFFRFVGGISYTTEFRRVFTNIFIAFPYIGYGYDILSTLEEVDVYGSRSKQWTAFLRRLMALRNLHTLTVYYHGHLFGGKTFRPFQSPISEIRHLRLKTEDIRPATMHAVLGGIRSLEVLHCGLFRVKYHPTCVFQPFKTALAIHRNTLREVCVWADVDMAPSRSTKWVPFDWALYSQLRVLSVPDFLVCDENMVLVTVWPPGFMDLEIAPCSRTVEELRLRTDLVNSALHFPTVTIFE
ncbi:hypothetical protein BJX99DRAFT_254063 [Aspergillus californicus]